MRMRNLMRKIERLKSELQRWKTDFTYSMRSIKFDERWWLLPLLLQFLILALLIKIVFFSDITPRVTEPARAECKVLDEKGRVEYRLCDG